MTITDDTQFITSEADGYIIYTNTYRFVDLYIESCVKLLRDGLQLTITFSDITLSDPVDDEYIAS